MSKFIDAEKLIAEIEKRKEERQDIRDSAFWNNEYWPESDFYTRDKEDDDILAVIDSLQQEQPEIDLKKEINSEWAKCNPIDEGMGSEYVNISIEQFDALSRHFFERGEQEMRHRITNPEYNAKVVKQLKSEYPIIKEEQHGSTR